ncbi:MAG: hypothetical protein Q7K34_00565 [archaeon]|nr:hypothetical protein [archaeon]
MPYGRQPKTRSFGSNFRTILEMLGLKKKLRPGEQPPHEHEERE